MSHTYEGAYGKITFDDDVVSIPDKAFRDCTTMTSIILPNSLESICPKAFMGCSSLTSITIPDNVFTNGDSNLCIYVPAELVEVYMRAEGWSDYADVIVGYDFENGVVVE